MKLLGSNIIFGILIECGTPKAKKRTFSTEDRFMNLQDFRI
ncbi:unnamed protein product, partial [marine sediment metagenome]